MASGTIAGSLNVLAAIANEQREKALGQYAVRIGHAVVKPVGDLRKKSGAPAKKQQEAVNPVKYIQELFTAADAHSRIPNRPTMGDFVKPPDEEIECYNRAVRFVRGNELEKLKVLHDEGKNLDACNRNGESLVMVACRRGHTEMVEFLIQDVKVRVDLRDDFGRHLLHDACWRPSPCVELMDALIKVVPPEWLLAQDVRGHTPFDYARREHWGVWVDFLKHREGLIKRRLSLSSFSSD